MPVRWKRREERPCVGLCYITKLEKINRKQVRLLEKKLEKFSLAFHSLALRCVKLNLAAEVVPSEETLRKPSFLNPSKLGETCASPIYPFPVYSLLLQLVYQSKPIRELLS